MTQFIPGLDLSEGYYREAVRPILDRSYPDLPHAAALIGWGSDVLGFDTPVSTDHLWGPRVRIFVPEDRIPDAPAIYETLRQALPVTFRGYSTHFGKPDEADGGTRIRQDVEHGPVDPLIEFLTIRDLWQWDLGVDPFTDPDPADWLTFAEHPLLTLTAGKVFHDDLGLEQVRARFRYYPRDVWLYLLAAQWSLIGQEEAFAGRTAQVGDELGSRTITARLVERIMRLCFLMEQRYAPYSKWFGTAFARLKCADRMAPLLEGALAANTYAERDPWMAQIYRYAVELHNDLRITPPVEPNTRTYSGWHALRGGVENLPLDDPGNTRPFQVVFAGRLVDPILAAIQDPAVLSFVRTVGGVNQFLVESSDALQNTQFRRGMKGLLWQK